MMMAAASAGRIGPNAVIQVAAALDQRLGTGVARDLMQAAGLGAYVRTPPQHLIDEREVIALHTLLRERLQPATATEVVRAAGVATGDYLLEHRIPRLAQSALRALPAPLAARLLLGAIRRHAWTFAGSGHFLARSGRPVVISIGSCPICRGAHAAGPQCGYYAATFQRLFRQLVHRNAHVRETACQAAGAACCRFEIDWD
jgi:divinyl protochlorophyllide a 8-vinyl-reductase